MPSEKAKADAIELRFKDTYLTRADMWRISSFLTNTCCYKDQIVTYCKLIRTTICEIYRNGKKVSSGYIGPNTRIIYRSDSSRLVFFIQMSSEMWHFEEQGHIIFHKMINSFFPEVFKRWRNQDSHHVVTIILFTTVDTSSDNKRLQHGETVKTKTDYFRVVVDQLDVCNNWDEIMEKLRYEFTRFEKDVLLEKSGKITGRIVPAVKGNILEAINMVTTLVSGKYRDRDLRRTGVQALIVTPGTGIYDVDYDLLYETSTKLTNLEIGIDLVCLGRPPLHVTPLFRFKDKRRGGLISHCVPSWLDISFWSSNERKGSQWIPRCKIYEIQMMGVMENEVSSIAIDHLPQVPNYKSMDEEMDQYDCQVFCISEPSKTLILEDDKKRDLEYAPKIIKSTRESVAPQQTEYARPIVTAVKSTIGIDVSGVDVPIVQPKKSALTSLLCADKAIKRAVSSSSSAMSPSLSAVSSLGSGTETAPQSPNFLPVSSPAVNSQTLNSPATTSAATGSIKSINKAKLFWKRASTLTLRSFYRGGDDTNSNNPEPDKSVTPSQLDDAENLNAPFKSFADITRVSSSASLQTNSMSTGMASQNSDSNPISPTIKSSSASILAHDYNDAPLNTDSIATLPGPLSTLVGPLATNFPASAINTVTSVISNPTLSTIGMTNKPSSSIMGTYSETLSSEQNDNFSTRPSLSVAIQPQEQNSSLSHLFPINNNHNLVKLEEVSKNDADTVSDVPGKGQGDNTLKTPIVTSPSTGNNSSVVSPISPSVPTSNLSSSVKQNDKNLEGLILNLQSSLLRPERTVKASSNSNTGPFGKISGATKLNNISSIPHVQAMPITQARKRLDLDFMANAHHETTVTTQAITKQTTGLNEVSSQKMPESKIDVQSNSNIAGLSNSLSSHEFNQIVKKGKSKAERREEEHSMWMTIDNPSNVPQGMIIDISNYGRWQYVYPHKIKRRTVKWRSLISPAALPLLSSNFPSLLQLRQKYSVQNYDAILKTDTSEYQSTTELVMEMVAIRISMGFQIISVKEVSFAERVLFNGSPNSVVEIVQDDASGKRFYMSLGSQIHRISFDSGTNVNVRVYTKHDATSLLSDNHKLGVNENGWSEKEYNPLVKTRFLDSYNILRVKINSGIPTFNWNQIDQILTGYEDYVLNDPRMYRMRLVLIPVDIPQTMTKFPDGQHKLTAEEIRLEGLRRLASTLHRDRYYSARDEKSEAENLKRDDIIPKISFYTGDLTSFLLSMDYNTDDLNISSSSSANGGGKNTLFIMPTERFTRKSFARLSQLATELVSDRGVKCIDRSWHWKKHAHCFIGTEMVNWLLMNFRDIETADEAVEYGNYLMRNGLFHHVENRHPFLNGHYFYRLSPEYDEQSNSNKSWFSSSRPDQNSKRPDSSSGDSSMILSKIGRHPQSSTSLKDLGSSMHSLGHKRSGSMDDSAPASPALLGQRQTQQPKNTSPGLHGISNSNRSVSQTQGSGTSGLSGGTNMSESTDSSPKPRVELSRSMRYNLDKTIPKKSSRPEILTVHLDRVHNPENCFQLRLEWLNTTPKFIDEKLVYITQLTEKYGLRLVQVPLQEINQLKYTNPFCSLFPVKMAIDPRSIIRLKNQANSTNNPNFFKDLRSPIPNIIEEPLVDDEWYYHKFVLKKCDFVYDMGPFSSTLTSRFNVTFSWGDQTYKSIQYIHKSGLCIAQIVGEREFVLMINSLAVNRIDPSKRRENNQPEEILERFKEVCMDTSQLMTWFDEAIQLWKNKEQSDVVQNSNPSSTNSTPQMTSQG